MKAVSWVVYFKCKHKQLVSFIDELEEYYSDISFFEDDETLHIDPMPDDDWRVELYFPKKPSLEDITKQIEQIAAKNNVHEAFQLQLDEIQDRDWVAEIRANSKPFIVGDFCVYNTHHQFDFPDKIPLIIDPTRAFGSGEHYTTKSCIQALSDLKQRDLEIEKGLDVGCGSGILAIAMAKLWKKPIIASDIEEQSVIIATDNVALNNESDMVTLLLSDGYAAELISKNSPYDIITCNILAIPLIRMASDLAANLKSGGYAILAGFLQSQEQQVIEAHENEGLSFISKIIDAQWSTIIFRKK